MPVQTRAQAQANKKAKSKARSQPKFVSKSKTAPKSGPGPKTKRVTKPKPQINRQPKSRKKLQDEPQPISRFLALPPELRLSIYRLCVPCGENLVIDLQAAGHYAPLHFHKPTYQATSALLLVCKEVYNEVLPLIYSSNALTILEPRAIPFFGQQLSLAALQNIRTLEVCMREHLADLGRVFFEWRPHLPSATHLKLNFYHSRKVLGCLGELAWRSWDHGNFELKVELYESIWATNAGIMINQQDVTTTINRGSYEAEVFDIRLPEQIRTITITASVGKEAANVFAAYKHPEFDGDRQRVGPFGWCFNKDGHKDTKTCKHLVWVNETGEVIEH